MNQFDRDEQLISEALQHTLSIQAPSLTEGVMKEINQPVPKTRQRTRLGLRSLAAAIAAVFLIPAVVVLGIQYSSYQRLMDEVQPEYGDYLEEVAAVCTDQGIRMEVVTCTEIEGRFIAYVTLEDTEGLGRVTEDWLWEITNRLDVSSVAFCAWGIVNYDEETGIMTYEITGSHVKSDDVTISMENLTYNATKDAACDPGLDLSAVSTDPDTTLITVADGELVSFGSIVRYEPIDRHDEDDLQAYVDWISQETYTLLSPGALDLDVSGTSSTRITGIGFVDGRLRVQISKDASDEAMICRPYLQDSQGNIMEGICVYSYGQMDGELVTYFDTKDEAIVSVEEYMFDIDPSDAANYKLLCNIMERTVLNGNWSVTVPVNKTTAETKTVDCDFQIDTFTAERAVVTPFGLILYGTWLDEKDWLDTGIEPAILDCGNTSMQIDHPVFTENYVTPNTRAQVEYFVEPSETEAIYWYADTRIDVESVQGFTVRGHSISFD